MTYRIALSIVLPAWLVVASVAPAEVRQQATRTPPATRPQPYIPYADARPILEALREDLLPPELRNQSASTLERAWPRWVSSRDAAIRARVAQGDDDSIINFTLLGTTFTTRPRITERELAATRAGDAPPALLDGRITDLVSGLTARDASERLRLARQVVERHGIDPTSTAGRAAAHRWLEAGVARVAAEYREQAKQLYAPEATGLAQSTLFQQRGLSSDTDVFAGFGIEQTLDSLKSNGLLPAQGVRRVAIVGPGLDFIDKHDGYDFYPLQTLQPFAIVDSLRRLGVASAELRVVNFDLSPRVTRHLESAAARARGGGSYVIQLPRNTDTPQWAPYAADYWRRFGDRIGTETTALRPPAVADLEVRAVRIPPRVVQSVAEAHDLNVVLQRTTPEDRFDLVIATNLLLYYDLFEQSLALVNVAQMLRPGGFFLTNTEVAPLPSVPLDLLGSTQVRYTDHGGDRIYWLQRR